MSGADPAHSLVSKHRLEALADGIFAIAMTILVLEIKVPTLKDPDSAEEFFQSMAANAPTLTGYVLSFSALGVMWYRHNRLIRPITSISEGVLVLYLAQFASAAFFPFCAAVFGRYPGNGGAIVCYAGCVLVYQWAQVGAWALACRQGLVSLQVGPAERRALHVRNLRGGIMVLIAFACSMWAAFR
ncbi:MAG: TMEM175 family protein [Phycisphaerales bacterium]